jgi:hypothetical protein
MIDRATRSLVLEIAAFACLIAVVLVTFGLGGLRIKPDLVAYIGILCALLR